MHAEATRGIESVLAGLKPGCLFLDVHTMAPYSPKASPVSSVQAVELAPGKMQAYIDAWTRPEMQGERRDIDIVTSLDDGRMIADEELTIAIERDFRTTRIPFRRNHPYPTIHGVMTTDYMQRYRGLAIDVPKDLVTDSRRADGYFDLAQLQVDMKKVQAIAAPIAHAILDCAGYRVSAARVAKRA